MAEVSLIAPVTPTRVIAVRGTLTRTDLLVSTPELTDAEPAQEEGSDVTVTLLAADGRALAEGGARTGVLAEHSDIPFVAQIPLEPAWAAEVASVRVSSARLNRQIVTPLP
jgi:hypothetical protein